MDLPKAILLEELVNEQEKDEFCAKARLKIDHDEKFRFVLIMLQE